MLETAHENSVEVFGEFDVLKVDLRLDDDLVDHSLVLESIDVLSGVRIDVLETLGEFVVQSINETDDASLDRDHGNFGGGRLVLILLVLVLLVIDDDFLNDVSSLGRESVEESVEVSASLSPRLERHVGVNGGVVV